MRDGKDKTINSRKAPNMKMNEVLEGRHFFDDAR